MLIVHTDGVNRKCIHFSINLLTFYENEFHLCLMICAKKSNYIVINVKRSRFIHMGFRDYIL